MLHVYYLFTVCLFVCLFVCEQKDAVSSSSSNDEEHGKNAWSQKKNSPQGKKPKERTSPPTSENDDKISVDESSGNENNSRKDVLDCSTAAPAKVQ